MRSSRSSSQPKPPLTCGSFTQLLYFVRQSPQPAQVLIFTAVFAKRLPPTRPKKTCYFSKVGDLSFVSAEFCPEPGRLWKSKTRRRWRDRGDATAHTWQWKAKARTCSSEVREREIAADWRHAPSDTRRDHCNRAARCQQGLGWCLCFCGLTRWM